MSDPLVHGVIHDGDYWNAMRMLAHVQVQTAGASGSQVLDLIGVCIGGILASRRAVSPEDEGLSPDEQQKG